MNLIANSTFETDATGWTAEGTEESSLETTEGFNSARAITCARWIVVTTRLTVCARLWSVRWPRHDECDNSSSVRWLKGHPEVLFRLRGNWLECAAEMAMPSNLGTPGAQTAAFSPMRLPAIVGVQHSPVLPAANQPIVVSAQVMIRMDWSSCLTELPARPEFGSYTTLAMNG